MSSPYPEYKSPNWNVPLKRYIDTVAAGGTTVAATVGDGVADDRPAIIDAIRAAPAGGEVRIPPGICRLASGVITNKIDGTNKSIHIVADGVTFLKDGDFDTVTLYSEFEQTYAVTELTEALYQENAESSVNAITIRTNVGPEGWRRGDVVKLVADDRVPYADTAIGNANQTRSGQHFTVLKATGNSIILAGKIDFPFTTNIRVAKLKDVPVSWTGGTFDVTEAHIGAGYTTPTFTLTACHRPVIRDVEIRRSTGVGIVLRGCFGALVDNPRLGWGYNSPSTGGNGYGVADTGSQGTRVANPHIAQARHAFTTGTNFLVENYAQLYAYGVTYETVVENGVADSCTGTAWDTHPASKDVVFANCYANNCTYGFASRSPDTQFLDCTTRNCTYGIVLFQSGGGAELPNNIINGYRSFNDNQAIDVRFGQRDGIPTYHVQQVQPTVLKDVTIRGNGRGIACRWGRFHIENLKHSFVGELRPGYDSASVVSVSSQITGSGWNIDYTEATGSTNTAFYIADDTGQVSVLAPDRVQLWGTLGSRISTVIDNPANAPLRIPYMLLSAAVSAVIKTQPTVGAWVEWEVASVGALNSGITQVGDTGAVPSLSSRDVIGGNFTLTADRTYPALPNPRRQGQLMIIRNDEASTGNLTIQHGSGFKTNLIGSANVVLTPNSTLMLWSTDSAIWQQIRGV